MDAGEIERLSRIMRETILAVPRHRRPIGFAEFPAGSCSDACLFLGTFFNECGISGFDYVVGERGSRDNNTWTTHAWMVGNGLIVDITADSFGDAPGPIVVRTNSPWHNTFFDPEDERYELKAAHLDAWDGPAVDDLRKFYQSIRPELHRRRG